MIRKLTIVFALLLLSFLCVAGGPLDMKKRALSGPTVGSSGPSYPDIVFYWGCESDTVEKSAGDNSVSRAGAADYDAVTKIVGSKSLDIPDGSDYGRLSYNASILPLDEGRIGFYIYIDSWVLSGFILSAEGDADDYFRCYFYSTDEIRFVINRQGSSAAKPTDINLVATQWYFIEMAWDSDNSPGTTMEVFVNGISQGVVTTAIGAAFGTAPVNFDVGTVNATAPDYHIDQIIISTDKTRDLYAIRNLTSFPD